MPLYIVWRKLAVIRRRSPLRRVLHPGKGSRSIVDAIVADPTLIGTTVPAATWQGFKSQ